MRRLTAAPVVLAALSCALVVSGCSVESTPSDSLQLVTDPVAAVAPDSPQRGAAPAGRVLAENSGVTALASLNGTLAVAVAAPPSLRLYDLADLAKAPREVPLPGPAVQLAADGGAVLASIPDAGQLARVDLATGTAVAVPVAGQPASADPQGPRTLVAVRDRKAVEILEGGQVTKSITGQLYSADEVLSPGDATVVLDRLRTALFEVDLAAGTVKEGLRAGVGATNATVDQYRRVLVTDTRGGALLAFSASPLLLRQRYPVPGGPYAIAYDARRDLAWVTLTERNEVVGFAVGGGEPVEKFRFPTVRQPNSVAVDETGSKVIVGSATGEGTQVIEP